MEKKTSFKKEKYAKTFEDESRTVEKHFYPHKETKNHEYMVSGKKQKFYRSQLQVVDPESENKPEERPVFDPTFKGRTLQTRVARKEPEGKRIRKENTRLEGYLK